MFEHCTFPWQQCITISIYIIIKRAGLSRGFPVNCSRNLEIEFGEIHENQSRVT